MNWKAFTAVCAAISALVSFPQNIIGCGGGIDPYDYYLSFFNQYASSQIQYQPFFYTNEQFLYSYEDAVSAESVLVQEWVNFTRKTATSKDVQAFVMKFPAKDINTLYYHIEKNKPAVLPDSIGQNSMSQFFLKEKNLEALGYILYAKKLEPHVIGSDEWEPETRDSMAMNGLLNNGLQLYKAAKTDLFRLKYGYQIIRLAHYNGRYADAIKYYDELISGNSTETVLKPMSLALKAGALFRLGKNKEAAYLFSRAFHQSNVKKISNYYGFNWSVVHQEDRQEYLSFCKNNGERADMLSLFALENPGTNLSLLKEVYQLQPASDLLSTLVVREINKYEEKYLTPLVGKEYNTELLGIYYYYQPPGHETDSLLNKARPELAELVQFLQELVSERKVKDPALMQLAAAYGAYMLRDFTRANDYLFQAKAMHLTPRLKDQWNLTNLLVQISATDKIDAAFEERILPSLDWLYKKAATRLPGEAESLYGNGEAEQWGRFYRNLAVDILSKRYKAQGEPGKAILSLGSAEKLGAAYNVTAVDYLRSQLNGPQAEALFGFLNAGKFTPYEAFLVKHNKLTANEVADFAGTAYLRDYNYDKAIEWLQKAKVQERVIEKDPFIDLLFDREERLPGDKVVTGKLTYAKEMKRLHELSRSDKANAAKHFYQLALGYYNVTHYGYAWELVEYWRSGADGYFIPKNATAFQKEYYGAFTAMEYFEKAMKACKDKEFRARCLFMMARCSQKQVHKPQYNEFGYNNYDTYDRSTKNYYILFASNRYFPQLKKEYGETRFFKEAETRCSYLRDFTARLDQ